MGNKKEARFDIIFQGAGKGESNDISFQFSGATLSDAVFSSTTSSVEHSNGELGGRYDYYDIENAVFYPTKERLERETKRVFDGANFRLVHFPKDPRNYSPLDGTAWNYFWGEKTEYVWSALNPTRPEYELEWNEELVRVLEPTEFSILKIVRSWDVIPMITDAGLFYLYNTRYNQANTTGFEKPLNDGIFEEGSSYGEASTISSLAFSSDTEILTHYDSCLPYPYETNEFYTLLRDTGSGVSCMAAYVGDTYSRTRRVGLEPQFAFEQSLVSMGCSEVVFNGVEGRSIIETTTYNNEEPYTFVDFVSAPTVWQLGFSTDIPGSELKVIQPGGTSPEIHYWEGCSDATLAGIMNTNNELWMGASTAKVAYRTTFSGTWGRIYGNFTIDQPISYLDRFSGSVQTEMHFSFSSGNNDEGAYDKVNIGYMFLFRADGSVDFVAELPNPVAVPRGCSFDLTTTIDHTPEVLII